MSYKCCIRTGCSSCSKHIVSQFPLVFHCTRLYMINNLYIRPVNRIVVIERTCTYTETSTSVSFCCLREVTFSYSNITNLFKNDRSFHIQLQISSLNMVSLFSTSHLIIELPDLNIHFRCFAFSRTVNTYTEFFFCFIIYFYVRTNEIKINVTEQSYRFQSIRCFAVISFRVF